ncbi:unnamed protein product [Closterium sp. NIES-53]
MSTGALALSLSLFPSLPPLLPPSFPPPLPPSLPPRSLPPSTLRIPRIAEGEVRPSGKALRRFLPALVLCVLCHLPGVPRTSKPWLGHVYR